MALHSVIMVCRKEIAFSLYFATDRHRISYNHYRVPVLIVYHFIYKNAVEEKQLTYRGDRSSCYATTPEIIPNSLACTTSITHIRLHAKCYLFTFTDFVDSLTVHGFLLLTFLLYVLLVHLYIC